MKRSFGKLVFLTLLFTILSYVPIHATGTVDNYNKEVYPKAVYEKGVETPFSISNSQNESINPATGSLSLRYTDIYLKGKNGMDLELTRTYNHSQAFIWDIRTYLRSDGSIGSTTNIHTFRDKYFDIGAGWAFEIPIIEVDYAWPVLHYGSQGTFFVKEYDSDNNKFIFETKKDNINLSVDYDLDEFVNGDYRSFYILTEKNGTKLYFDHEGRLIGKVDRYGNTIKYNYTIRYDQYNAEHIVVSSIIDTCGRVLNFQYDDNNNRVIVSLTDGTVTKSLYYNFAKIIDETDQKVDGFMEETEKVLDNVTDFEGRTTSYEYIYKTVKSDLLDKDISNKDDSNMYTLLQRINYPTGANTLYLYTNPITRNMGEDGCMEFFKLSSRQDYNATNMGMDTDKFNTRLFIYNVDSTHELDGYPMYYRDEDIPETYQVKSQEIFTVNTTSNVNKYTYDKHALLTKQESSGNHHKVEKIHTYDDNHLPLKTVTKNYNKSTDQFMKTVEDFEYDIKGNLLNYWGSQSPRDANDQLLFRDSDEYKMTYIYDDRYNLVTEKNYKRDASNTIKEQYVLSSDGKSVEWKKVMENTILKEQTRYIKDSYGNVSQKREYIGNGNWNSYITTNYSYNDNAVSRYGNANLSGAYLTKKWVTGIVDADNMLVVPKTGQSAGTIEEIFTYDYYGNVLTMQDGEGHTTEFQYDKLNRLTRMNNPDGTYKTKIYISNLSENSVSETNENGYTIKNIYDQIGKLVYKKDMTTNDILQQIKYDNNNRIIEEYDANGNKTKNTYLSDGRITLKKRFDASGTLIYNEQYEYDEAYNNGEYYKTKKSVFGAPWIVTTSYTDKSGNTVKTEGLHDSVPYVTTFKYDYLGNLIEEKNARANSEAWTNPYTSKIEYDYAGRVVKSININGDYNTIEYDALGRIIKTADIKSNKTDIPYYTSNQYDNLGRLIISNTPFEEKNGTIYYNTLKNYYDRNGNVVLEKSSNNISGESESYTKKEYRYNSKNMLTTVALYNDGEAINYTQYYYDNVGNILRTYTGLSDPLTIAGLDNVVSGSDSIYSVTKNSFDHLGRLVSKIDPLGQNETYDSYDKNGNLLKKTDRNGYITTMTYDGLNRVLTCNINNPSDGNNQEFTYTYNYNGNIATESDGDITTSYTYDDLGRKIQEDDGSVVKKYTYDANNNYLSLQVLNEDNSIINTSYTYDHMDRLQTVTENGELKATYTYDENSNRKSLVYTNGNSVIYNYNLANVVTELINKQYDTELSHYINDYSLDGNKIVETESINGKDTSYVYDDLGRLITETNSTNDILQQQLTYTYDDVGNRATLVVSGNNNYNIDYNYDLNNRLSYETKTIGDKVEMTQYSYDPNGNTLVSAKETVSPSTGSEEEKTYILQAGKSAKADVTINHYNLLNQLTKTDTNGISSEYTYNTLGIRTSKKVNDQVTQFILDGGNVIAEINDDKTTIYSRGINLISCKTDTDEQFYLFNDHGDVVHRTNNTGSIVKTYDYDAFGIEVSIDINDSNPFRYCGEYYDVETGTYYLRARYYNPYVGRFITEDSYSGQANDPLSLNRYTYCVNNPVVFIDPSGFKHIISDYTYTYEERKFVTINLSDSSTWLNDGWSLDNDRPRAITYSDGKRYIMGEAVKEFTATLTKHEFTNLNFTVYETMDGSGYSTYAGGAFNNEGKGFIEAGKSNIITTIDGLISLDDKHKHDKAWAWVNVSISGASDIFAIGKLGKAAKAAENGGDVIRAIGRFFIPNKDAVVGNTIVDGIQGEIDSLAYLKDWGKGLIPIYGTYLAVVDATSNEPLKGAFVNIQK